jgi:hypothetical protein
VRESHPSKSRAFGVQIIDPVSDVVHTAARGRGQRSPRDRFPQLNGEGTALGERHAAFNLVLNVVLIGDSQQPYPRWSPAKPEDLAEFMFPHREVGDGNSDVPN